MNKYTMSSMKLSGELTNLYRDTNLSIKDRLNEFEKVDKSKYFYELCFCMMTPMSKAENAIQVQQKLESLDFFHNDFDPTHLLLSPEHYIRFHNQKSKRLRELKKSYPLVQEILESNMLAYEKRNLIARSINGIGMKEASHFMRNIGYRGLAILDRHILNILHTCDVLETNAKPTSAKSYLELEEKFLDFSRSIGIPIDELDLLFWSYKTGYILK